MPTRLRTRPLKGRAPATRGRPAKAKPKTKRMNKMPARQPAVKVQLTRARAQNRSAARPSPRARSSNMNPTDVNPIWALYRSIGDTIKKATGG